MTGQEEGKENGALAGRICGAGGGGCMTMFCKPGTPRAVIAALEDLGAEHIPYSIDMDGLNVRVGERSTHALRTTPTSRETLGYALAADV